MSEQLLIQQEKYVKYITLNNPRRKNALTKSMMTGLSAALQEAEKDGTRVIVLQGAEGNFSSGADLMAGDELRADVTSYLKTAVNPTILAIRQTDIPVIASISGVCVGLGCNLALACDMLLASKEARFSQIFTNIALSADGGGSYFLPRMVGYQKAFEWMALASMVSAEEAYHYGMLNRLYETPQELQEGTRALAQQLAEGPFIAIKHTKANLRKGMEGSLEDTLNLEAENQGKNFLTKDFLEGIQAFFEKRKPKYQGK